jgi:phosphohistidine phosphatase SixA
MVNDVLMSFFGSTLKRTVFMIVYLMRHGEAARPGADQPSTLTAKGRSDVERMAHHLASRKVTADILWHSPKTRSIQTAEILLKVLGNTRTVVEKKEELSPNGDIQNIFRELLVQKAEHFFITGHLPSLGDLASHILEDVEHPSPLVFAPAGLTTLEWRDQWKWLWDLNPATLRR